VQYWCYKDKVEQAGKVYTKNWLLFANLYLPAIMHVRLPFVSKGVLITEQAISVSVEILVSNMSWTGCTHVTINVNIWRHAGNCTARDTG